jgi:hypothetical protein
MSDEYWDRELEVEQTAIDKKEAEIERIKSLITELADLIYQGFGPSSGFATYKLRLKQAVQRAREAVK